MKLDLSDGLRIVPESDEDTAILEALGWQEAGDVIQLMRQEVFRGEGLDHLLAITPHTVLDRETMTMPKGLTVPEQVASDTQLLKSNPAFETPYTIEKLTAQLKVATAAVAVDPVISPVAEPPIKVVP